MKTQAMFSVLLYASLTACGAESGSTPTISVPVTVQPVATETKTEAKVEAKAQPEATVQTSARTESISSMAAESSSGVSQEAPVEPKAAKLLDAGCIDPELSEIKSGVVITLCDGSLGTGTLASPVAPDLSNLQAANIKSGVMIAGVTGSLAVESHVACTANNQTGCIATATFKAADLSNLSASNLKSGVTVAGVSGSLVTEAHVTCNSNNQTGCVANSTYKAVDTTNLLASNLKTGVAIAGVTGTYPSAAAPLASGTATADLDAATFNLKIKSDAQFEYFDSTGARHTQTGNSALSAENIRSDVSLFNVSGTLEPAVAVTIDPWDLRAGTTVAGVTGKMKTHCRTFDNNTPTAAESCGEAELWQDLTSTVSAFSDCASASGQCLYKNRVTNLYFSKGFAAAPKNTAINSCDTLVYGGFSDWRLPSTEEAIQAATMGASGRGFLSGLYGNWTTNVYSSNSYIAIMSAAVGMQSATTTSYPFFCVRK